jgi:Family of unknown function (DUF6152)
MKMVRVVVVGGSLAALLVLVRPAPPVFAHHSFGHYDMAKTTDITGAVVRFEWSNPHCWLFVDVVASPGAAPVTYGFEMQSVGELLRAGYKKTSFKAGDMVTVRFRPMRDGTPAGLLVSALDRAGQSIGRRGGPPPTPPPANAAP